MLAVLLLASCPRGQQNSVQHSGNLRAFVLGPQLLLAPPGLMPNVCIWQTVLNIENRHQQQWQQWQSGNSHMGLNGNRKRGKVPCIYAIFTFTFTFAFAFRVVRWRWLGTRKPLKCQGKALNQVHSAPGHIRPASASAPVPVSLFLFLPFHHNEIVLNICS